MSTFDPTAASVPATTPPPPSSPSHSSSSFASLPLPPSLLQAVEVLGFHTMTPVQAKALPPCLASLDVIAQAKTGSGKTAAFGLAALARTDVATAAAQVLVLTPTRELADQVSAELRRLGRFMANLRVLTLCGGVPVRTQTPSLQTAPQVIVGTPGRIGDHLARETLDLRGVKVVVLDEADRMLDMGFKDAIADVLKHTPRARQTLLFSATFNAEVRALSTSFQRDAIDIKVDDGKTDSANIEQSLYVVDAADKTDAVVALLLHHDPASALVFCHTRNDVRSLTATLQERGFSALSLHGELEQWERDEVMVRFANQSCAVLVATDVAARGLDVKGLAAVISYELPTDPDTHRHRIGRTGRAGEGGLAFSLSTPAELDRARAIEAHTGLPMPEAELPATSAGARAQPAPMITVRIDGGKKDKLRPGDILGALTGDVGVPGDAVGTISITPTHSFVAVARAHADTAVAGLGEKKIKGRRFRCRILA
jgi:ATP-independent RNA helicase DbpA